MIKDILELYTAGMAGEVRTPVPHLLGPPGCGKSTFVEKAAKLLGVRLHTINVSRISPLELEGVQMPTAGKLELLLATYWNSLQDGDIVFLDEFLRGFPEVYNGLLDILTSRRVAGHDLPRVFFIAASNSIVAYDPALTDRLLHLDVPDPRSDTGEHSRIIATMIEAIGLLPCKEVEQELDSVVEKLVHPMYKLLDQMHGSRKQAVSTGNQAEGVSPRNLIGQAQLRRIVEPKLASALKACNAIAADQGKPEYVVGFHHGKAAAFSWNFSDDWAEAQRVLVDDPDAEWSPLQVRNMRLNLELHASDAILKEATA